MGTADEHLTTWNCVLLHSKKAVLFGKIVLPPVQCFLKKTCEHVLNVIFVLSSNKAIGSVYFYFTLSAFVTTQASVCQGFHVKISITHKLTDLRLFLLIFHTLTKTQNDSENDKWSRKNTLFQDDHQSRSSGGIKTVGLHHRTHGIKASLKP